MITHLIPATADAVRRRDRTYRALCRRIVPEATHARDGHPTCPDCARIDAEDSRALDALAHAASEDYRALDEPDIRSETPVPHQQTWGECLRCRRTWCDLAPTPGLLHRYTICEACHRTPPATKTGAR
ncbi:MAG: hypothetical protein Q8S13_03500 [Dehalococcoidia bacterium]|nr:hypothetical protein [Dehalococcoidia bacterium]